MKMEVQVFKDSEALSLAAAEIFVTAATEAVLGRNRFLAALSGGNTPSGLYRLLAEQPFRKRIRWSHTFIFWGDERCVPPENESSNHHQAYQILLRHVPIPDKNILRIKGELDPTEASSDYAQTLKRFATPGLNWPRFDLVLLGMGADGHTASLFPSSQVEAPSPTLAVSADYQGRPSRRVTLTPMVFNSARTVLFLVTGADKAEILSKVIRDVSTPDQYPAQRIHPWDGKVIWMVDKAAASSL